MKMLGVLVIDDEPDYIQMTSVLIEHQAASENLGPIRVLTALHPAEGQRAAREADVPIAIIAVDGLFPTLSLHHLCGNFIAHFAERYKRASIIANSASRVYAAAMQQAGCTHVCAAKERLPQLICNQLRLMREAEEWVTES